MEITLEQVEKLREKADVSYEEARALLEKHHGDLLEALIELERRGKADTASSGGFYTTRPDTPQSEGLVLAPEPAAGRQGRETGNGDWRSAVRELLYRSTVNYLEVWQGEVRRSAIPILVVVLLVIIAFYITVPLLLVGLLVGFRYRFSGPDLDRESLNKAAGKAAETAEGIRRTVKDEWERKHPKK